MRGLFLSLVALIALGVESSAHELSGVVKSASGQPLAKVYIFYGRSLNDIAETDDRGSFSLPHFGRIISFRRSGFRPLTKIVNESITKLDIVLEEAATTEWVIPSCPIGNHGGKRVGYSLRLRLPKEAIAQKGHDVDYRNFSIGYGPKEKRFWLSGIEGPMATLGVPPEAWILNAKEFSERSYRSNKAEGVDMRGRLVDGTYWRYIGRLGESMEYSGLSHEAAAFFDKIIDAACVAQ